MVEAAVLFWWIFIVHDLLLAKLSTYGFDYSSLKLINSFLRGRKFRMKISSSYSPYLDLLVGVPQRYQSWVLCFSLWVFFTFFKLYKWYQIVQRITYANCRTNYEIDKKY